MTDFAARVSRVRMKQGGAEVRVLATPKMAGGLAPNALRGARIMAEDDQPVVAYMLVGLYADGRVLTSGRCAFPDDSPHTRFGFVGIVTEATREHLITQRTAVDVFNREDGE